MVDEKPFVIKGITYAATKIGQSPDKGTLANWMEEDTNENGLIDGYVALLNAKKLGLTLMAFIGISMDKHTSERFTSLEQTLSSYSEVMECHLITGQSADYLLKVIVKDMDAYQGFLIQKLTKIEGVSGVHTSFVLKSAINSTTLPVN